MGTTNYFEISLSLLCMKQLFWNCMIIVIPEFFIPVKPNLNYQPCNLKYVGVTEVNVTTEQNSTLILFKNRTVGQIYDFEMSLDDLQTPDRHCRCGVVTKSTPRISLERFTGAIKLRANQRAVTMTTALRWQGAVLLAGRSPPHSAYVTA